MAAKTKKHNMAKKTADRVLLEQAMEIIHARCSSGRSATDTQLWDQIKTMRDCKGAVLVSRIFEIGIQHGYNRATKELVKVDKDRDSYAAFCKKCGKRWAEHTAGGACMDAESCAVPAAELL